MERSPDPDAPLQCAADVRVEDGMMPAPILEHATHPDAGLSGSTRPLRPSKAPAGLAAAGLSARSWPRADAYRARANTRWQSKTPSWPRRRGEAFFGNPYAASSCDQRCGRRGEPSIPSYRDESTACTGHSRPPAGLKKRAADRDYGQATPLPSVRPQHLCR